jgi:hypothetical protein
MTQNHEEFLHLLLLLSSYTCLGLLFEEVVFAQEMEVMNSVIFPILLLMSLFVYQFLPIPQSVISFLFL